MWPRSIGIDKLLRIDLDPTQGPGELRAAGARSPPGRGSRVWKNYWICDQLFPGQGGQVRSKWATDRDPGQGRPSTDRRSPPWVRIPIQSGRVFRFDAGHHSDLKPAAIPR